MPTSSALKLAATLVLI